MKPETKRKLLLLLFLCINIGVFAQMTQRDIIELKERHPDRIITDEVGTVFHYYYENTFELYLFVDNDLELTMTCSNNDHKWYFNTFVNFCHQEGYVLIEEKLNYKKFADYSTNLYITISLDDRACITYVWM